MQPSTTISPARAGYVYTTAPRLTVVSFRVLEHTLGGVIAEDWLPQPCALLSTRLFVFTPSHGSLRLGRATWNFINGVSSRPLAGRGALDRRIMARSICRYFLLSRNDMELRVSPAWQKWLEHSFMQQSVDFSHLQSK